MWVPFSVLNAPNHNANTRLVWLLLCLRPDRTSSPVSLKRLYELSGLGPQAVAHARARLAQAPLGSCGARPQRSCAAIPEALLTASDISPAARLLFGQLQSVPDFERHSGSFTYAQLSHLTGSSDDALRRAVAELANAGWLTVTQTNRKSPVTFTLRDPVSTRQRARLSAIRRKIKSAPNKGEALLREFLNTMVALDKCEENATPDFLLNPYTGELMELDRYYPTARVAFEFQGDQHFEPTDLASFEVTVKQIGRDAMKAFICKARGIELVPILTEDLSWKALEQKLPGNLPRRDLQGLEHLVALLEGLATEYRGRATEERARKGLTLARSK